MEDDGSSSFFSLKSDAPRWGDHVIIYISPEDVSVVQLATCGVLQNRLGRFMHADMIGKPYGSQIRSADGTKHLHMLRPTPELWTRALPHRTQIIYLPDISFIIEMLDLRPGRIVIESGTGSGSLTHSLARAIGPHGKLHTFDFHEVRAEQAGKELEQHGLSRIVTVSCRDVCRDGFGLENEADAVFLDLPSPWLAVGHAKSALKKCKPSRIACFSPCIEQVQRTIVQLYQEGFQEIEMYECLSRTLQAEEIPIHTLESHEEKKAPVETLKIVCKPRIEIKGHTSYLYFATLLPEDRAS